MSIFGPNVEIPPDAAAAEWLRPRLGQFGTVGGLVPTGYERYVLVRLEPSERTPGDPEVELAEALADLGRHHTATPELVWYAFWEGYGWETTSSLYFIPGQGPVGWLNRWRFTRRQRALDRRTRERVRRELADVPTFELPSRRYYLLCGALNSASRVARPAGFGEHQAPDLWWPEDRSWFVATDTDLDWLYVGGTERFFDEIVAAFRDRSEPVLWEATNVQFTRGL